jgi:leucyl-tRNA synthetase
MTAKYDHRHIEKKWQKHWEDHKTYEVEVDYNKPKYYVLDMFPYPSGAGLHVGHVTGYTVTDIIARYKRQMGFNVLHPMGWDSFGLPAEQYAIRTGTHPAITTKKNIDTYRKQLKSLGFSYDWSKEIATSDPDYYKWTQWIFGELYKKGLAYEAEILVNYCPELGTVLANEEVEDGKAKEGGFEVVRKPLKQWILKITEYADRLLEDLDLLDWPEHLKKLQRNWIGKSVGANIHFTVVGSGEEIVCFTTRPDTLFGVSYVVIAPEHPLVSKVTTLEHKVQVDYYLEQTAKKSDMERTDLNYQKTGVFTGSFVINPLSQKQIPIYVADYVLAGYGTGAVMAVPAHDERDFAFALQYHLPIIPVIHPDHGEVKEKYPHQDGFLYAQDVLEGKECWTGSGMMIHSSNAHFSINHMHNETAKKKVVEELERIKKGQEKVSYKLRDWLFSRQRYWGEPFPIIHFLDGSKRVLDVDELPLTPPEMENFKPSGDGRGPLAKVKSWVEIDDSKTHKKAFRETNTMPQWAGSCWYYLRYLDPKNSHAAWNKDKEKYWMPVDLYVGGVEHAVLHLLYARFWHKVLYDLGHVSTKEPFACLKNQGLVVAKAFKRKKGGYVEPEKIVEKDGKFFIEETKEEVEAQIEKMSKSKLNGVTPDEMIEEYGADALRLYEMFMGPFDKEKLWNTDAVSGCRRFLNRFYDLVNSDKVCDEELKEATKLGVKLVKGVESDLNELLFNTCISKMMEFVNGFSSLPKYPRSILKMAAIVLHPFAPHLAEECFEILGGNGGLAFHPFPKIDESVLASTTVTFVVQVNGKLRGTIEKQKGTLQEVVLNEAKNDPKISAHIQGEIKKVIFVPDKLLNILC